MNEERGAALRLLFQIKLAIEKLENPDPMSMTNIPKTKVDQKWGQTKELGQTLKQNGTLSTAFKSQKLKTVEQGQLRFEQKRIDNLRKAEEDHEAEQRLVQQMQQEMRQKQLETMADNRQFMRDWDAQNKKNWQKNQQKKREMIARAKYFEDKEVQDFKNKLNKELALATGEMSTGIAEFNKNMLKIGVETNINFEDAVKKMETQKGVPPGQIQNFSYAATMNKIKEGKLSQDQAFKERDRRRRKMIVDQKKTQSELEKKKYEEDLISRLTTRQADDQKEAYTLWRQNHCKKIVTENQENKYRDYKAKRETQMEEALAREKAAFADSVEERKRAKEEQQRRVKKARWEEKLQKRAFNIEVCSEILDLIVDIANEAHEKQQKGSRKFEKAEWRSWMSHFKNNKPISLVMFEYNQSLNEQPLEAPSQSTLLNETGEELFNDFLSTQSSFQPHQRDMLSFFTLSGDFNLTYQDEGYWSSIRNQLETHYPDCGLFFDMRTTNESKELAQILSQKQLENLGPSKITASKKVEGIPKDFQITLALAGPHGSGKKSISKFIQNQFGDIQIFSMAQIIKESIEYVNPKPKEEAADPKAKAKKGVKAAEEAPSDPFEGLDTADYKQIGNILKKYFGEKVPCDEDIVAEVNNDVLLAQLFAFRLKLQYAKSGTQSQEDVEKSIKTKLQREEEIRAQLLELEDVDPKKKGKGKTNEEGLREELEKLQQVPMKGWILTDFPRTLNQAKAFEEVFSGFICMTDKPKSQEQVQKELWQKIVQPDLYEHETSIDEKPKLISSGADGLLLFDVTLEEAQRRLNNRKIDPQTQTIYHMEDNPPPEGDAKLKDRLQDYTTDAQDELRLKQDHQIWEQEKEELIKWSRNFGLQDSETSVSQTMLLSINEPVKQEETQERVKAAIGQVVAFRQKEYEVLKEKVRQDLLKPESEKGQEQQEEEENKQEQPEEETRNPEIQEAQSQQSKEKNEISFAEQQPSRTEKTFDAWAKWQDFQQKLYEANLTAFKQIRKQKAAVHEGLVEIQNQFVEFLEREDLKQNKINDFIESFNRFASEFPELREDEQTKEELMLRLNDNLNNDLWNVIEQKKDEAIQERQKTMNSGFIANEIQQLSRVVCLLLQFEINKFSVIAQILKNQEDVISPISVEAIYCNLEEDKVKAIQKLPDGTFDFTFANELFLQVFLKVLALQVDDSLQQEKTNLCFRLNVLRSWCLSKMRNFEDKFQHVLSLMDDWIVATVKKENYHVQQVVQALTEVINGNELSMHPGSFQLPHFSLENETEDLQDFTKETEDQLTFIKPTDKLSFRFKIDQIENLYKKMKKNSFNEYLEFQTALHLVLLRIKEIYCPLFWRWYSVQHLTEALLYFQITPPAAPEEVPEEGTFQEQEERRQKALSSKPIYIDWKRAIVFFLLLGSELIKEADLQELREKLFVNPEDGSQLTSVTLQQLLQFELWFDESEALPEVVASKIGGSRSQSQSGQNSAYKYSHYDSESEEEEQQDLDRLQRIKTLFLRSLQDHEGKLQLQSLEKMPIGDTVQKFHELIFPTL